MKKKHSRIFRSFEWTEFKPQLRLGLGFGFGFGFGASFSTNEEDNENETVSKMGCQPTADGQPRAGLGGWAAGGCVGSCWSSDSIY